MLYSNIWLRSTRQKCLGLLQASLSPHSKIILYGAGAERLAKDLRMAGFANIYFINNGLAAITGCYDLIISCFATHKYSDSDFLQLVHIVKDLSPQILLIDWQNAERNLHLPFVGLVALAFRFANYAAREQYQSYIEHGALEGFLYRNSYLFAVEQRLSSLGGCVGMALVHWKNYCSPMIRAESGTTVEPGTSSVSGWKADHTNQNV